MGPKNFLVRSLQQLLDEKEIKRHANLKKECQAALDKATGEAETNEAGDSPPIADPYFHIFQSACATKNPRLQCVALDGIEKLVAYGYLKGSDPVPGDDSGRKMIDDVVNTICDCFSVSYTEDAVCVQVIKAGLTVATSSSCEVHGESLLKCLQTIYSISLAAKPLTLQATAKAAMTQILTVLYSRMEAQAAATSFSHDKNPATGSPEIPLYVGSEDTPDNDSGRREELPSSASVITSESSRDHYTNSEIPDSQTRKTESNEATSAAKENGGPQTGTGGENSSMSNVADSEFADFSDAKGGNEGFADFTAAENPSEAEPATENGSKNTEKSAENVHHDDSLGGALSQEKVVMETGKEENGKTKDKSETDNQAHKQDDKTTEGDSEKEEKKEVAREVNETKGGEVEGEKCGEEVQKEKSAEVKTSGEVGVEGMEGVAGLGEEEKENIRTAMGQGPLSASNEMKDEPTTVPAVEISAHTPNRSQSDQIGSPKISSPVLSALSPAPVRGNPQGMRRMEDAGSEIDDANLHEYFSHPLQVDAYMVFRSLCRLSMRDLSPNADPRSYEYRTKILSMDLLLTILNSSGPCFQHHPMFVGAIREYLCISLSKNAVSPQPTVFELSLSLFLSLLAVSKTHIKYQIEVLFKDIFLPILETSSSSFQHKWLVLQALSRIFADPQTMVDIYINFDCQLATYNIFGRMVTDVAKIAQGRAARELGAVGPQEQRLGNVRGLGLECLATCLESMARWVEDRDGTETDRHGLERAPTDQNGSETEMGGINASTSSLTAIAEDHQDIETQKKHKNVLEDVLAKFNDKPKKGLKYAQEKGLCGREPGEVAKWFQTEERLSKTAIGEYIGENDEFCKQVMYAYIDALDFRNLDFVDALRKFLEGFRLPGEAQKIDRLMEKFAARFCQTNPQHSVFANADTAYVLAYSIIMLTTDLHSAHVLKKMTVDEFVKNNRGINDGNDLPREFLVAIYEDIKANEIRVKDDRSGAQPQTAYSDAQLLSEPMRRQIFHQEMASRLNAAQATLSDKAKASSQFVISSNPLHVRPMFAAVWTYCLAAFSVNLNESSDPAVIRVCLEGFRQAICISGLFGMVLERDTFVASLVKFTGLNPLIPKLSAKNVEAICTLLTVAHEDGNNLQGSWHVVLKCISQIDVAQHSIGSDSPLSSFDSGVGETASDHYEASRGKTFAETNSFVGSMPLGRSPHGTNAGNLDQRGGVRTEDSWSQAVAMGQDRVFTGSVHLHGEAIIDFVKALCAVSTEELSAHRSRMYSLQKVVEIAYYNMDRIRIEWSKIWGVLGEHFNKAGCHPIIEVGMFAVDALRQLSMKFLERGELAHFHFQKDFLKPFEYIMNHNKNPTIRDMIAHCLANMIQSQGKHIRSGWKNIFYVYSVAAFDPSPTMVHFGYSVVREVFTTMGSHFYDIAFVDGVNCLVEYASNRILPALAMEAVDLIESHAVPIVAKDAAGDVEHSTGVWDNEDDRRWVQGWFPIFFGLHRIMTRSTLDVRTRALTVIIDAVKANGHSFHEAQWQDLFLILFRIFDDLKLPERQSEKIEWMQTTCQHALFALLEIFTTYFDQLAPIILPDLFDRILWCAQQSNEQLARAAAQSVQVLLLSNGQRFTPAMWDLACDWMATLFDASTANELFDFDIGVAESISQGAPPPFSFHDVIIKCVVQLELIQAVENALLQQTSAPGNLSHGREETIQDPNTCNTENGTVEQNGLYPYVSSAQLQRVLDFLRKSHDHASAFNGNQQLRLALWKAGFMKQPPNLLKQETSSLHASLSLLFRMYEDPSRKDMSEDVRERIDGFCREVVGLYVTNEGQREVWAGVMQLILEKVAAFDDERFCLHMAGLSEAICTIIENDMPRGLGPVVAAIFRRMARDHLVAKNGN